MKKRDWALYWPLILTLSSVALGQPASKPSAAAAAAKSPTIASEPPKTAQADQQAKDALGSGDQNHSSEAAVSQSAPAAEVAPAEGLANPPPPPPFNEPPKSDAPRFPEASGAATTPRPDDAPPTLLSSKAPKIGGYGGLTVLGSRVKSHGAVFVGGEAALLLDHRLAIGLAGYGLATHIDGPLTAFGESQRLAFGYGGFLLRYSFLFRQPYYVTVGALVGAGGVAYTPEWNGDWSEGRDVHGETLFVVEPSVGLHLNLTRWMRLGAQLSYRFISGAGTSTLQDRPRDKDLAGFAYGGQIQFGWF